MSQGWRRSVPSWRNHESRGIRLDVVLGGLLVLLVLLGEVWQSSTVASLSFQLDHETGKLRAARAALSYENAQLDKSTSRTQLGPMASVLGLRPVDPAHIVSISERDLPSAELQLAAQGAPSMLAYAGKALQSLVPDASARGRHVN